MSATNTAMWMWHRVGRIAKTFLRAAFGGTPRNSPDPTARAPETVHVNDLSPNV
ncbi:MAG: hypothetical protein WEA10_10595 [Actinomycetota bacterium]